MSRLGIVIVTYNSGDEIGACLDAALGAGAETIVVDNASTDQTIAEIGHRGARLIANSSNRGFAAAANQGFTALTCPFILLLNPDAVIKGSLEPLIESCEMPHAAGAGGKLLDRDGHPQIGFMARNLPTTASLILEALLLNRLFPKNRVNRHYRALDVDYENVMAVEQPAGAFLMIKREVWQELGGFDEGFQPLWFEDVDFCRRAIDRGYWFCYTPWAVAVHTGAHSITKIAVELRRFYWYRNLLRYTAKHFRPLAFRAVSLAVVAGSVLRGIAEVFSYRSLKPLAAGGKVVRLAARCLLFGRREAEV